jgi:hypothetical protein
MFWQWGQFLAHDTDLTTAAVPPEPLPIAVPRGDPLFDPDSAGTKTIDFVRSIYDPDTGTEERNPRQQLNLITSFIDASNVYGSDAARANALRLNDGTGKLKSTEGGLYLPYNTVGLANAGGSSREDLYLAGDVRANEQIGLTAMHTLFVREHNRLCDEIARAQTDPPLSGDEIYQRARKRVGAYMQVITYNEFLPVLLGPDALSRYSGYRPEVNPSIANEFSTAAYRFGHSMLSPMILRVDEEGNQTYVPLANAFFNPTLLKENGGIDSILRGLAGQMAQEVDTRLVDGVRNFLFGPPGAGGFDLASLNIQRVRDHGLSSYIRTRNELGLPEVKRFSDITSDRGVRKALKEAYGRVHNVDLWTGGLAEDHVMGALLGETFRAILIDQFTRLRRGDRFWYQNDRYFTSDNDLMAEVESTTLADIIRRNTSIGAELQDNVMLVSE